MAGIVCHVLTEVENVQPANLNLLLGGQFRVWVFVGENQSKLHFELALAMQQLGTNGRYVEIAGAGANALDFHNAFYLGELSQQHPDHQFHVPGSSAMTISDNNECDGAEGLIDQVNVARAAGTRLLIRGGGSKAFYGNPVCDAQVLDCTGHRGVVAYEPSELFITARCGTPLAEVEALLGQHAQQLPFEPPHFGPGATVGGMVAAGLSGPRRPYAASVRDALLGVRLLNGQGQALDFGGRVMKNVAGYDLSRLMAGALGTLGVLLEVSLKVTPVPPGRLTLVHEADMDEALALVQGWARRSLPITGTAWLDGRLYTRICGSEEGLAESQRVIGGLPLADADGFWTGLREQQLPFFQGNAPLWRISVPPATPVLDVAATDQLIEWGGALRWLRSTAPAATLRELAGRAGGHATLFRAGPDGLPADGVFQPLAPVPLRLHRNLKQAFDPLGLFNPGRLYPGL